MNRGTNNKLDTVIISRMLNCSMLYAGISFPHYLQRHVVLLSWHIKNPFPCSITVVVERRTNMQKYVNFLNTLPAKINRQIPPHFLPTGALENLGTTF